MHVHLSLTSAHDIPTFYPIHKEKVPISYIVMEQGIF